MHGAMRLHTPGCWKVRRPLGGVEEEARGQPGPFLERREDAEGETSCCGGGMTLLELFDVQSMTQMVMIVAE